MIDWPDDHPLRAADEPLDTFHWSNGGKPLGVPTQSKLQSLETADIPLAITIRQEIIDIATLTAKAVTPGHVRTRLVIRDGLALHFDLYSSGSVQWSTLDSDLIRLLNNAASELADLNLRPNYGAVTVEADSGLKPAEFPVNNLGAISAIATKSVAPSCLTIFDAGVPSLLYLDSCGCQSATDAIDMWYMHVISCIAARGLLVSVRHAVRDSASELNKHSSPEVSMKLKRDLSIALASQVALDDLRRRTNILTAQASAVTDFRALRMHQANETDPHSELIHHLDREFDVYFGESLSVALNSLRTTSQEVADRSSGFLDLSNMAYNVRLQESLKLLQWLSVVIAAVSLVAAIAAIIIAL
jgi:hypothetical protein